MKLLSVLILSIFLFLCTSETGFTQNFDDYKKKVQAEWGKHKKQTGSDWKSKQANIEKNWDNYLNRVKENWKDSKVSSKEEFVNYSADFRSRAVVNFADDKTDMRPGLVIDVLVSGSGGDAQKQAEEKIKQELEQLTGQNEIAKELAGSIDDGTGQSLQSGQEDKVASRIVKEARITKEKDPAGKDVIHYQVELPMVPDHLNKRASRWRLRVTEMAKRWKLPADLIFAVIQTESYFNPMARSHVPAFGLMQLVPRYGGKEAWEVVYGVEQEPDAAYLYNGDNNIELGVAYLHRLRYRYYGWVEDDEKAYLLITTSYNTGPGNTNKALTSKGGSTRNTSGKHKGFKKPLGASSGFAATKIVVRNMSLEELREKLLLDLPWEETVGYLEKVSARRQNYLSWNGH
jgi:membrane-bound lytic murein transglycosylase C